MFDDQHGLGHDARIGWWPIGGVGEAPVSRQALADDLLGRAPAQHALAAGIVGRAEAGQQALAVAVAGDGDPQHLALDPAVEALRHPVRARRVGPGLAVLDAELAAELLEALGGEAAAAIRQHVRDPEGEGRERLLEEGPSTGLGLVVLDREVDRARALVEGHEQEPLAPFAVDRSEEHTSELQSRQYLVCRLLLEKKTHSITPP